MAIVFLLMAYLLPHGTKAQMEKSTYVIEAYGCACSTIDSLPKGRNSIQLGVRLDASSVIHTALGTLPGCKDFYLNVNGARYPIRLMSINERDGLAKFEPVNVSTNALKVEELWRASPSFVEAKSKDVDEGRPNYLLYDLQKKALKTRTLGGSKLMAIRVGGRVHYEFMLPKRSGTEDELEYLTGGPVWFSGDDNGLLGLVTA